jgi:hypothetical protein
MTFFPLDGSGCARKNLLLAPNPLGLGPFRHVILDSFSHGSRLSEAQRLRGRIALQEEAIHPGQLDAAGRHVQAADRDSWHLLSLDCNGRIAGCLRYRPHEGKAQFENLTISRSALAHSKTWGGKLRAAVEADLLHARRRGCSYVELGGWVIEEALRCTTEAVRMIATAFAFAQLCGGALGISMASTRRCSSAILKRIGGQCLQAGGVELPSFYDAQYRCHMEILRFDSTNSNPRYRRWMEVCRLHLHDVPVICPEAP